MSDSAKPLDQGQPIPFEETEAFRLAKVACDGDNAQALAAQISALLEMEQAARDKLLREAAFDGAAQCVELLLPIADPKAIDPTQEGRWRATALMAAAAKRETPAKSHARCVELLLPLSDPSARDVTGESALTLAVYMGASIETQKLLLAACGPGHTDGSGKTLLMLAAQDGSLESVDFWAPMSDFSARDHYGDTALAIAISEYSEGAALRLLPRSDPNAENNAGQSPFSLASHMSLWRLVDAMAPRVSRKKADAAFQSAGPANMPGWAARIEREALAHELGAGGRPNPCPPGGFCGDEGPFGPPEPSSPAGGSAASGSGTDGSAAQASRPAARRV